ncbi:helix-turn-helix domain-containing protein [Mycetocola miduiensis]|uniref:DNA binding domain-containing protein, excisionase family n=1 Tax=Mycetocola miduiensis TaxID=995034 RepID=A0A1I5AVW4_9MICO|nr:helix-turn-helix domain-containing protein [Mycetocola miduiensis]SFN66552.1 DNA binding domain-containing protein, excisionase family [Mycetocola miduiensis]
MSTMKPWLTVAEAAVLVKRHPRKVYAWIENGTLKARRSADGKYEVSSTDALRVESVTKRGRPAGTASHNSSSIE